MLRTRTDLWRLALFSSLGLCPNACGGKADTANASQPDEVTAQGGSPEGGTSREAGASTPSPSSASPGSSNPGSPTPAVSNPPSTGTVTPQAPPDAGSAVPEDAGPATTTTPPHDGGTTGVPRVDGGMPAEPAQCAELIRGGVNTGLVQCDDGVVHRPTAAHLCQSSLPRSAPQGAPLQDSGLPAEEGECQSDADCTDRAHGYCDYPPASQIPSKACHYGCTSDADCASDEACVCGDPVGQCISAGCKSDADCAPEMKCAEWVDPNGIGCPLSRFFSCQTPRDECATDADCASESFCSGAAGVRQCETIPNIACGRPFLVAGSERLAALINSDAWIGTTASDSGAKASPQHHSPANETTETLAEPQRHLLGQRWAELGLMEHASIAAFARFTLQLLHLGAPATLIEDAQRAMMDETQHARNCFSLASHYLRHAVGPAALHMDQALQETSLEEIVRLTVREGCIGETCAALEAAEAYEGATDPRVKAVLEKIRSDEYRHAELAWRFVSWALTQGTPSTETKARLHDVVAAEFASAAREVNAAVSASAAPSSFDTLAHGIVPRALLQEIRHTALRDVVLPCAAALLQSLAPREAIHETSSSMTT